MMRGRPHVGCSPKYILVIAAVFAIIYNLLHFLSVKPASVNIHITQKTSQDTPLKPAKPSKPRESRQVEFTFPAEGYPASTLRYDFNGITNLPYLLELREEDGKEDAGEEFLPWTRYCKMSRYCKPAKEIQDLYTSEIGCKEILPLLEQIRECISNEDDDCKMILNRGFWRDVYAIDYKGTPVVLKSLKAKHVEARNYLRQIRETIALDLVDEGKEWVVKEMGHCTPDEDDGLFGYTSMVPKLRIDLEDYLKSDLYEDLTLDHALSINIMCAAGVKAIHEIPGGPFVHNDLQPRQYLVTDDGRVLLNDLNRGKFLGRHEKTGERCGFCGSKAKGRWRSPEELSRGLLSHKLDIFSLGDVMWSTYAWGDDPLGALGRKEAMQKIKKGETPEFTHMTPPEVRDLIRDCWEFNPENRPEAWEIVKRLNKIRRLYLTTTDLHAKRLVTLDFDE